MARKALLLPACMGQYRAWMDATDPCESPVEATAFLSLCASLSLAEIPLAITRPGEIPKLPDLADSMVLAQVTLQEPAEEYRIDIAVHFNCRLGANLYCRDLAIECDGTEYHSSPVQRARDDMKSRVLTGLGYSVFRFSGTEVWNQAPDCNERIMTNLRRFCGQLINGPLPKPTGPGARVAKPNKRLRPTDSEYRI